MMLFSFSHRKATQALNFFARKAGGSMSKLRALKLVYFADRYHLRKFGRPITNDEYFAMPYGPVASGVKDLAEKSEFLSDEEREYADRFLSRDETRPHDFFSHADVDKAVLSESDLEALEFAWRTFGRMEPFELVELTHRYPEWVRHEPSLTAKVTSRAPMDYADFLEDPVDANLEPCHALSEQDRSDLRDVLKEAASFESRWL